MNMYNCRMKLNFTSKIDSNDFQIDHSNLCYNLRGIIDRWYLFRNSKYIPNIYESILFTTMESWSIDLLGKITHDTISRVAFYRFWNLENANVSRIRCNLRCWQRICPRWETWVSGDSISLLSHDLELADMKRGPCPLRDIQYTSDALDIPNGFQDCFLYPCALN